MNSLCLNRISKDLKEITKSPIDGIGIVSLDNDPKKYVVNMRIMTGIFEGYCLQLLLTFSDNYPIKPPRILIYPGQGLDNTYHHHIFPSDIKDEEGHYFHKFCFDLLENDFMPTSSVAYTGWNPSYTISTILLQVQIFLSNPDFYNYIPEKEKIDILMESMNNYERAFKIKNDKNEEIIKVHTWKDPYPIMYFSKNSLNIKNINLEENKKNDKLNLLKEDLTCYISRLNYIDNRNIILGYPIQKLKDGGLVPIPEILSYDCFIEESSKSDPNNRNEGSMNIHFANLNNNNHLDDLNFFLNEIIFNEFRHLNEINFPIDRNLNKYKSANNEFYYSWLPIYINDENFEENKTTILNYFSIVKFGNIGLKQFDFQPQYIFEILFNLLSKMINKIIEKNISSSFLKCFFQYIFMFKKFEKKYNNIFIEYKKYYLDNLLKNFTISKINEDANKSFFETLTLFLLSDNDIKQVINAKIKNYIVIYKDFIFMKLFKNEDINKYIEEELLTKDLKKNKLFDQIFYIIFDYLKENNLFSTEEKLILLFEYDMIKNEFENTIGMKFIKFYHTLNIKTKLEILRAKIFEQNFLDKLEENFGIYFDCSNFIEQLKFEKKSENNDKYDPFKKNDFLPLGELISYNSLYNRYKNDDKFSLLRFLDMLKFGSDESLYKQMINLSYIYKKKKGNIIREIRINEKENLKKKKTEIKNFYHKINNARLNKYINKKNITRLLLYKRNYY